MSQKDRPTNDSKTLNTRIRLSAEDIRRLEYCAEKTGLTKAEIIRQDIKEIYEKNSVSPSQPREQRNVRLTDFSINFIVSQIGAFCQVFERSF